MVTNLILAALATFSLATYGMYEGKKIVSVTQQPSAAYISYQGELEDGGSISAIADIKTKKISCVFFKDSRQIIIDEKWFGTLAYLEAELKKDSLTHKKIISLIRSDLD